MTTKKIMDLYRELILDHYKHPRNFGHLDHPDASAEEHNLSCGDRIIMELKLTTDPSTSSGSLATSRDNSQLTTISDIRFNGEGCAISQASASMLTEEVMGKSVEEVMKLKTEQIIEMLGTELTPSRIKCGVLSLEVLQKAVHSVK